MKKLISVLFVTLIAVTATFPTLADVPLTGTWSGKFVGVQIQFPSQRGPFGLLKDNSRKPSPDSKFTETPLTLDFSNEKNGLAVGTWKSGEFSQNFVCAQISSTMWNCVDAGGRGSLELKSSTQLKVCYLDNREGAQGAGCGLLQKSR